MKLVTIKELDNEIEKNLRAVRALGYDLIKELWSNGDNKFKHLINESQWKITEVVMIPKSRKHFH